MAIRVKFEIDLSLSENSIEAKELGMTPPWKGTNDQQDDGGTWRRKIVAGATDVLIDLNGLANGRLIAVKTNKTVLLKKNSAAGESWPIRPLGTGALDGIFFCTTDGITALYVTNGGSEDAEVTFTVAGIF
jgi:hypothetical protein